MMAAAALAQLDAAGVRVRLRDDGSLNLTAAAPPPLELLSLARAHRDGIAALLANRAQQAARGGFVPDSPAAPLPLIPARTGFAPVPDPPGVPRDWRVGVARLATMPSPAVIPPRRWTTLAATSARLLRDHGAALHGAGWDTLDLFGLHAVAPTTNPPGWGLAWLLGEHGEVLDLAPDVIGMRQAPGGARLAYWRPGASARAGVVTAWLLKTHAKVCLMEANP